MLHIVCGANVRGKVLNRPSDFIQVFTLSSSFRSSAFGLRRRLFSFANSLSRPHQNRLRLLFQLLLTHSWRQREEENRYVLPSRRLCCPSVIWLWKTLAGSLLKNVSPPSEACRFFRPDQTPGGGDAHICQGAGQLLMMSQ